MNIVGILSVRDAVGLDYPFTAVVNSMSELCDKIIVGVDSRFPADYPLLDVTNAGVWGKLVIQDRNWNDSNINAGSEIAHQMDQLVKSAREEYKADWVVVLQADEVLHEKDCDMIRSFCSRAPKGTKGFSMERLYFWEDLKTVRQDWNADLIRVFRPSRFSFLAEGTDKAGMYAGALDTEGEVVSLPYKIYHYSRVGNASNISKRVRNLDGFFHEPETLVPVEELKDYDFVAREYDNYSIVEAPKEVEGKLVEFLGTHPAAICGVYER